MSKRLGLLIVMMLFVSLMTGCFGSDDSSTTTTPTTAASVVITGSIPALSAPAGAPNYMVAYGTNYEMGVFNAATMTEITGSAVVINGTTYTATVPAGAANVTAVVVIKHKTTGKVVYSALAGILPTSTAMSTAAVSKVTVSGVNLNGESTAIATLAKDKGIVAPSVPVSSTVTTMPASVKSAIDSAVGTATLTAITNAVSAVQAVLNNSGVSEATKSSILSVIDAALANVLNAFVAAVKDASAVVNTTIGATTVSVGGQTIGATSTTTDVTSAVNGVTVVTITAVTNPADITVASGTAVTAITFPTTVSVTKSNGTTATASVVWSTTSTPAYVATTAGTYTFTGTVSGTTLTASVKVIVGAAAQTVATPTFSPAEGTYTAAQSVTIATTTTGASIYYTTDGTTPTTASTAYTTAINVAATTTIKAIAVKTGMTNSAVASAVYTINISNIPVLTNTKAVKQANGDVVVTWTTNIVTPTAAKVIIRGSVPTPSDPSVTETVSTTTSHTVTVPAATFPTSYDKLVISYIIGEDGTSAEILKAAILDAATLVADPVITPAAGTYTSAQSVTITCATTGASIYYTVDGTTPTTASTLYTAAFNVSASATVKAIATATGMTSSSVVSAAYVINISTTKVLTGIALAKATDTVEANVAYTLPAVTASYDDTTSATVTASWAEGATAVTGTSVTKTTAGTYTFTATYTEGTVTKTSTFTLVVTEAVPVKTLDSIVVTANPTAPTCLVGGTTSVALTAVAHYLTGTATSEAAITTFTTGSNWANSIFTAATTVAGTENIVVSYTEGGVTKTANVAVTVSVEAPKVTTVTVTAITIGETLSTQSVVLVKDQTGATMTTGYTLTYTMSNAVATVSTTGLVTAGTYNSTSATGTLTVTATPTTGTAVNGTATVTVTADTTKPTLVSASAVNNKTMLVTYSKKMKDSSTDAAGALNPANYKIYSEATGVTTQLRAAAPASTTPGEIQATIVFNDTTNTVVKISIVAMDTTVGGYPAGGLDSKNYRIYVKNVVDVAATPNAIINDSNVPFVGSTTPDSSVPKLIALTYNKGTGLLTMTFDKAVTNAVTYSKVKFNGVALSAAGSVGSALTSKIEYTVSSNDRTTIAALTGTITVTLEAGAVNDTSSPVIANELTTMVPTLTVPPSLTSAVYDETANKLTLGFDQTINLANSAFLTNSNFQLKSTEMSQFAIDATDTLVTTANGPTIEIMLSSTHIAAMEGVTTHTSLKMYVKVNAVESASATKNLQQDDTTGYPAVSTTVVKDTVKPVVTSITYNESTKKLVFNFNVAVQTSFTGTSVSLKSSADDAEKDNLNGVVGTANGTALEFDLNQGTQSAGNAAFDFAANIKLIQQGILTATTPNTYDAYFTFSADVFTKSGSTTLKNIAVSTKATATTVVYTDNVAPGYAATSGITATNKAAITVVFNEKLDKTSAETATNYTILDTTTNAALAVHTATMTDSTTTKKTVVLYTDAQTTGDAYRLSVVNVKDIASTPNTITTAIQGTFTGVAGGVTVPVISTVTIEDVDGSGTLSNNDKFKVTFNEPVKFNVGSYTDLNNVFTLTTGALAGTAVALTKATIDAVDAKIVYITYTTSSPTWNAVTAGTSTLNIKAAQTYVVHKYDATTSAAAGTEISINPPGDRAAISTVTVEDVNNNAQVDAGDKVYITFNKQVKRAASGSLASADFKVYLNGAYTTDVMSAAFGTLATTDFASSITDAAYGTTATITIPTTGTPSANPTKIGLGVRVAFAAAATVVDSWGVGNAVYVDGTTDAAKLTYATITGKNTIAAPQVQSVQYVDANGNSTADAGDYLVYAFNVPVFIDAAIGTVKEQWKLGAGTLAINPVAPAFALSSDRTKVKVELAGADVIFTGVTTSDIASTHADFATNCKLVNFNGGKPTTNGNGLVITADTTSRPAITSVEYISVNKIKIKFDRAIALVSKDVTKMLLHNNGSVVDTTTGGGNSIDLDTNDTTNVTLLWTLASGGADQSANVVSGFGTDATITGLGIAAGSGIKAATSGLEIVAFGAATTASDHKKVAADTTAPDAITATQLTYIGFDNANLKAITNTANALVPSEKARVEIYVGADTPAKVAGTYTAYNVYNTTWAGNGTLIASALGSAATTGHKVFYRFKDVAGNITDWAQDGTIPTVTVANFGLSNIAANAALVINATTGNLTLKKGTNLDLFYHAATTPTGATVATKAGTALGADATVAAGAAVYTLTAVTTAAAADKVWYKYTDENGNISVWVQDGTVPAAPSAAAIKVGTSNTANYISNASKAAPIVSVTPTAGQLATDVLFASVTDSGSTTVQNATGVTNPTTATATDVTLATCASLVGGSALAVKGWVATAEGNRSSLFAGTAGTFDIAAPTAVVGAGTKTLSATSAQITFNENVAITTPAVGRFTAAAGNIADVTTPPAVVGAVVTLTYPALTFATTVASVVDYAPLAAGNAANVKDLAGNEAVAFTDTVLATGF